MRLAFHTAHLFDEQPWDDGPGFIDVLTRDGPPIASRHILNGGGKGGQSSQNQTTTMSIPPEVMARYNAVNSRAEDAAAKPFQPYGGQFVAPVNETQQGAIQNITDAQGWIPGTYQNAVGTLGSAVNQTYPWLQTAGEGLGSAQGYGGLNQTALNTAGQGAGQAQPYNMGATGLAMAGTQAVNPGGLAIGQYMSPYNEAVVQSTLRNLQQQQGMDKQDLTSNAILSGSYGGDRSGIAMANLERQQGLATGQVASQLYNQNYGQALQTAQQQQGVGLGAEQANRAALQQGAGQIGALGQQVYGQGLGLAGFQGQIGQQGFGQGLGLAQGAGSLAQTNYGIGSNAAQLYNQFGTQALQNQLAQGQAQLGAGTVQQQTNQADLSAQYNQFLQQQGYPFQTAQFLANIAMGTGAQSGNTTSTMAGAFQPQPYFSDKDLKHDIKVLGHTKDGIPIVRFRYKGQGETHIGFLAQDVEKVRPEAVGESHGYKTVDYDRATKAFGGLATAAGGSVSNDNAYEGFAAGGIPGLPGGPISTPPLPGGSFGPFDPLKPGEPAAAPPAAPAGLASSPMGIPGLGDFGSANAATGAPGTGSVGASVGEGASVSGGDAGSVGAGVGGNAGTSAGVGGDDGGTYWAGGRAARAGGGGLGSMGDILASQKSLYEAMPGQKGREVAGSSGGLGVKPATPRPMQASQVALPAPAQGSGLSRDLKTIGDVSGALKSGKELYKSGKDAYDWMSDKWDAWADNGAADAALRGVGDTAAQSAVDAAGVVTLRRGGRARRAAGGGLGLYGDANLIDIPLEEDEVAQPKQMGLGTQPSPRVGGSGGQKDQTGKMVGSLAGAGLGAIVGMPGVGSAVGGLLGGLFERGGRVSRAAGGPTGDLAGILQRARAAIKSIESSGRYDAIGPASKNGDRPWGAYQVMGSNIPQWTKAVTGTAMTPHQFLNSPEVQDRVFDHFFGGAMLQHGNPQDAASVWFSGRPVKVAGNDRDVLGTSVPAYIQKFNAHMGYAPDMPQGSPATRALQVANDTGEPSDPVGQAVDDPAARMRIAKGLNEIEGAGLATAAATGGRIAKEDGGSLTLPEFETPGLIDPNERFRMPGPPATGLAAAPPEAAPALPAPPPSTTPPPAATPVPPPAAPPAPPQTGLAAAPPDQTAALGPQSPSGAQPGGSPGFFDKGGWLSENERPVMAGLTFLGNMLASPSRTLAGSVGTGLAAAAQAYPAMGFKQQGLDISKQNADTTQATALAHALDITSARIGLNPNNTALQQLFSQQLARYSQLLNTGKVDPAAFKAPESYGDPRYANLKDEANPDFYFNRARVETNAAARESLMAQGREALKNLREQGWAPGKGGERVEFGNYLEGTANAIAVKEATAQEASIKAQLGVPGSPLATSYAGARITQLEQQVIQLSQSPKPADQAKAVELGLVARRLRQEYGLGQPARAYGGRIRKAGGGAGEAPEPDVQVAQAETAPDLSTPQGLKDYLGKYGSILPPERSKELNDQLRLMTDQATQTGRTPVQTPEGPGIKVTPGAPEQKHQETIYDANKDMLKNVYARAEEGRTTKQLVQTLRNTLYDKEGKPVTTMGPYAQALSRLGATMTQVGVDPELVKRYVANPNSVDEANKLVLGLAGAVKSQSYPGAGQESFLRALETGTPNVGMLPEAVMTMLKLMEARADIEIGMPKAVEGVPFSQDYRAAVQQHLSKPENMWYQQTPAESKPAARRQDEPQPPSGVPESLRSIKGLLPSKSTGQWLDPATRNVYAPDGTLLGKKP